ncbi:hypothetical protein ACWF95_06800 [Streptomyces vinaceus]|uniref:hypothetical protein n=1 Tax=Streptomyces sp. NPDC002054 TaxID=3154663 RepID=UPI00332FE13F
MAGTVQTAEQLWEYVTYAPPGSQCTACLRGIETLEPVRRGCIERASASPVVIYRHANECPNVSVAA